MVQASVLASLSNSIAVAGGGAQNLEVGCPSEVLGDCAYAGMMYKAK